MVTRVRAQGTAAKSAATARRIAAPSARQNGGISHHPDELTSDEDVGLAVEVLSLALARL